SRHTELGTTFVDVGTTFSGSISQGQGSLKVVPADGEPGTSVAVHADILATGNPTRGTAFSSPGEGGGDVFLAIGPDAGASAPRDDFGESVAWAGDQIVVGAPGSIGSAMIPGAVYLFPNLPGRRAFLEDDGLHDVETGALIAGDEIFDSPTSQPD